MQPYLAMITPFTWGHPDQGLPPVSPGYPDQGLPPIALPPGSIGGTPDQPIYYPPHAPDHPIALPPGSVSGTPEQPIYYPVRPSHPIAPGGRPIDPGFGWPGRPGRPIDPGFGNRPGRPVDPGWGVSEGRPDQGLPVPPEVWPNPPVPPLPPELASSVIVAVHRPGQEWVIKSYPVAPGQGLPETQPPVAQPK